MSLATISIVFFASTSYLVGFYAILKYGYRPNLFSRVVFLCISINNLVSVFSLSNQSSTIVLAGVTFFGSLLIFIGAILFKGENFWGKNESISTVLLVISLLLWFFTNIPILNLLIGLVAHSIGSLPTLMRVIKRPESENITFWLLFAVASYIAFFTTHSGNLKDYVFSLYFVVFDTSLTLLSARKYLIAKS